MVEVSTPELDDVVRLTDHYAPCWHIGAIGPRQEGALADPESEDPKVLAQRQLHEAVAGEDRVSATTIQTAGGKGYDGFMVALVEP